MTSPTPMKPEDLDQAMAEATRWQGSEPELWKKALEATDAAPPQPGAWRRKGLLNRPLSNRVLLSGVACIAAVFIVGLLMPSLSSARRGVQGRVSSPRSAPDVDKSIAYKGGPGRSYGSAEGEFAAGAWREEHKDASGAAAPPAPPKADRREYDAPITMRAGVLELHQEPVASPRYVVQKATMELQTDDVRAAFAKAAHLVSEVGGEFVESSSLTGDGKTAQGNMTLRVAASHVGEVMNKLREFGKVKNENTTGEDVTTQVVDVEARIRNEQRVEQELLQLLEKRTDAPLKDILELRASLSSVRQSIEQLVGQRDRLGRLVSLASILVVIRAQPVEEQPVPANSIGAYFIKSINRAWHGGLEALSDTIAWFISVGIGGIMWWIALAAVLIAIFRWRRRLAARCV